MPISEKFVFPMTGLELKALMEENHLSLQLVAIRVSCILGFPVSSTKIRGWAAKNAKLDPRITEQAILSEHSKGFLWEGK